MGTEKNVSLRQRAQNAGLGFLIAAHSYAGIPVGPTVGHEQTAPPTGFSSEPDSLFLPTVSSGSLEKQAEPETKEAGEALYPEQPIIRFTSLAPSVEDTNQPDCTISQVYRPTQQLVANQESLTGPDQLDYNVFLPGVSAIEYACTTPQSPGFMKERSGTSYYPVITLNGLELQEISDPRVREIFPSRAPISFGEIDALAVRPANGQLELVRAWPMDNLDRLTRESAKSIYGLDDEQVDKLLPPLLPMEDASHIRALKDVELAESMRRVNERHIRPAPGETGSPIRLILSYFSQMYSQPSSTGPSLPLKFICGEENPYVVVDLGSPAYSINSQGVVEVYMKIHPSEQTACDNMSLLFAHSYVQIGRGVSSLSSKSVTNEVLDDILKGRQRFAPLPAQTAYVPDGSTQPVFNQETVTMITVGVGTAMLAFGVYQGMAGGGGSLALYSHD